MSPSRRSHSPLESLPLRTSLESNKTEALAQFKSALTQFEACAADEAADMIAQCKKIIPQTMVSIAKEQINDSKYDEALETLKEATACAEGYGQEEIAAEAKDLVPTAYVRKGAALMKAKDFVNAAAAFKGAVALTPEDGQTQLLYGQALMQAGDNDTAVTALEAAAANGKEDQAGRPGQEAPLQPVPQGRHGPREGEQERRGHHRPRESQQLR